MASSVRNKVSKHRSGLINEDLTRRDLLALAALGLATAIPGRAGAGLAGGRRDGAGRGAGSRRGPGYASAPAWRAGPDRLATLVTRTSR